MLKDKKKDFELQMDEHLGICTTGRVSSAEDTHHHAYEPTPYKVLELLAESGYLNADSHIVDYGCGKGRVGFYLAQELGCHVNGIEYDESIYQMAVDNQNQAKANSNLTTFQLVSAEKYEIQPEENTFYFFNPFSIEILRSVMGKILASYYENPRELQLFFYYPDMEYVGYLMSVDELEFVDEIDCESIYGNGNARECIMIFKII